MIKLSKMPNEIVGEKDEAREKNQVAASSQKFIR